ncbi:adenosylcobinamide-GDP ribazoletransferase [Neorhizobium huautlense]|uniref:Adenosylcobinamide-GDP ribazoletransferase n=1 Tax=Neorhizobium huautlense TaxID=67774 RepID=A0ABT9Q399_9HYPH|nr:adenosylcobinamide-GDP ribazoletransferase [Neorhizobium huautlense]MDP9840559.1 adenosylcobinamide-GDP ribazoletransferase [Neorhizobium huautlense]
MLSEFIADIARSVGFLSRLPVHARFFEGHDGSISRAVRAFPVAGVVIALPAMCVLWAMLVLGAQPFLAAILALGTLTVTTGALHEDGFADAADGLGGGRDKEHALAIMKDSRTGSYGVVALILSFGIRASALAQLGTDLSPFGAALALLAAASVSRALMVWHWSMLPPARTNGVAVAVGKPEDAARTMALALAALLAFLFLLPSYHLGSILFALAFAVLAAFAFTRVVDKKLGGHTGDTIGATQQVTSMAVFTALALAT